MIKTKARKLRVGDLVEVRSKDEILATLDRNGELDGMPFMPEMFAFCGQRFQVYKRAHKTCDTVFPVRGRRVDQAVHLDTRCDGSSHGGCEASCLLFWKQAWLKPIGAKQSEDFLSPARASGCTEADVATRTRVATQEGGTEPVVYSCQATRLPYATTDLDGWDFRQYVEDYTSGNVSLWRIVCGAVYMLYYKTSRAGFGLGRPMRWFYDTFHPLWGGTPFPRKAGIIPVGQPTPAVNLDLQPGELVRVKSQLEILKTVNTNNGNRGLYFDAEEAFYCGKTHRVLKSVTRLIDEKTGKILHMKTPCIVLDSVVCQSRYSECRLFCPRSIYAYWRENWLERVDEASGVRGSKDERLTQTPTSLVGMSSRSGSRLKI